MKVNGPLLQKKYFVRNYDVNVNASMKTSVILQLIQEISEEHAASFGLDRDGCLKYNIAWVIARTKLEITRLPKKGEEITITTWPGKIKKILYPRYVIFLDTNGQELLRANTVWSLFDLSTRSLSFIDSKILNYPDLSNVEEFMKIPSKITDLLTDNSYSYTPSFNDFDCNKHVNNVKYVEWLENLLGYDYLSTHKLVELQIDYFNEVVAKQIVNIQYSLNKNQINANYLVEDHVIASCKMVYKEEKSC